MFAPNRIFGSQKCIAGWLFAGAVVPCGFALGQEPSPLPSPPQVTLRYRELTNRQDLKFKMLGQGEFNKPVGDMHFEYPTGSFPINGLDPVITSYCVEPLIPMYAGSSYPFTVDTLDHPKFYADPETVEGVKQTERRVSYIRELYGKHYQETLKDPKAVPAFQAALWELTQERELPEGPMPFNLFAGSFQADYANVEQAPEFVRQAQTYVQNLTGDEAAFTDNSFFKGMEIVRLSAVRTPEGIAAQSQFVLRNLPLTSAGGGGASPIGSGIGGGGGPLGGGGGGGPASGGLGGIPGLGGAGVPFLGLPGTGGTTSTITDTVPTTSAALTPETVQGPSQQGPSQSQPVTEAIPTSSPPPPPSPSSSPPPPPPPVFGPPPPPPPPPSPPPPSPPPPGPPTPGVPAPPAVLLGALGVGLLALRRAFRKKADLGTTELA